jgi:hypothetical protein
VPSPYDPFINPLLNQFDLVLDDLASLNDRPPNFTESAVYDSDGDSSRKSQCAYQQAPRRKETSRSFRSHDDLVSVAAPAQPLPCVESCRILPCSETHPPAQRTTKLAHFHRGGNKK